jgi:hypothetical protein
VSKVEFQHVARLRVVRPRRYRISIAGVSASGTATEWLKEGVGWVWLMTMCGLLYWLLAVIW